jgi:hypothetical protein
VQVARSHGRGDERTAPAGLANRAGESP